MDTISPTTGGIFDEPIHYIDFSNSTEWLERQAVLLAKTDIDNIKPPNTAVTKDAVLSRQSQNQGEKMPKIITELTYDVRPNGLMRHRFTHRGDRKSIYCRTIDELLTQKYAIKNGTHKPKKTKPKEPEYTVGGWVLHYYNIFRRSKGGKGQQWECDRYIMLITEKLPHSLKKATADQIQAFINSFDNQPATQHKITGLLLGAFEKAFALGKRKDNPCAWLEQKRYKAKSHPVMQFVDQRTMLAYPLLKHHEFIAKLCSCTGMRIGELAGAEFDFDNHVITVTDEDKVTKRHQRQIPFLPNSFITPQSIKLLKGVKVAAIKKYFNYIFKRMGVKAVTHSFRVTFISVCNFININPKQIQAWAGHSSIQMTMDTYAKLLRKDGTSFILDYLTALKEYLTL